MSSVTKKRQGEGLIFQERMMEEWLERTWKTWPCGNNGEFPRYTEGEATLQVITRLRMFRESWVAKRRVCILKSHWSRLLAPRTEQIMREREEKRDSFMFFFFLNWRRWIIKCYNQERDEFRGEGRMHISMELCRK